MDTPPTVKNFRYKICPTWTQDSPVPRRQRAMQQRSQGPLEESERTRLFISLLWALVFGVREQRLCPSLCSAWRTCLWCHCSDVTVFVDSTGNLFFLDRFSWCRYSPILSIFLWTGAAGCAELDQVGFVAGDHPQSFFASLKQVPFVLYLAWIIYVAH